MVNAIGAALPIDDYDRIRFAAEVPLVRRQQRRLERFEQHLERDVPLASRCTAGRRSVSLQCPCFLSLPCLCFRWSLSRRKSARGSYSKFAVLIAAIGSSSSPRSVSTTTVSPRRPRKMPRCVFPPLPSATSRCARVRPRNARNQPAAGADVPARQIRLQASMVHRNRREAHSSAPRRARKARDRRRPARSIVTLNIVDRRTGRARCATISSPGEARVVRDRIEFSLERRRNRTASRIASHFPCLLSEAAKRGHDPRSLNTPRLSIPKIATGRNPTWARPLALFT